ncbi:MAG: hypothetical protein NUW02_02940 [Candidatus Campbellbacteria bacterium]|nr:hypothetical protein [Candidatus Campbellbacteria bacterium]
MQGSLGQKDSRIISILPILFLLFSVLTPVSMARASSLFLNPSSGTYAVGSIIPVDVIVDTDGKTINAISGTLEFPEGVVKPTSVKKNDSIVTLWIQQPSISAERSEISFEGLVLNPGFSGRGKVLTVYFEVLGTGSPVIAFSSGLTLANDGFGTNILETLADARYEISGISSPIVRGTDGKTELPLDQSSLVLSSLRPPVITGYTNRPKNLADFFVQGVTYPNAKVNIWLKLSSGDPKQYTIASDEAGNFSYRYGSTKNLVPLLQATVLSGLGGSLRGIPYQFWLGAVVEGVETPPTQAFEVTVGGIGIPEMLLMVIILLILGVVGLLVFEMILLRRVYEHDHENYKEPTKSGS